MSLRSKRRRRVREIRAAEMTTLARGRACVCGRRRRRRLAEALEALEPDRPAILALHHLEGRSVAEIAATLEIPVVTAESDSSPRARRSNEPSRTPTDDLGRPRGSRLVSGAG